MKLEERLKILSACKWVDEIIITDHYSVDEKILDDVNC